MLTWLSDFDSIEFARASNACVDVLNKLGVQLKVLDISSNVKIENDDIVIQHLPVALLRKTNATIHIGYTNFEFPLTHDLSYLDHLIVPSKWHKDILNADSIIPYISHPTTTKVSIRNKKSFTFLSVLDLTYEKGLDLLLQAYWTEFRSDEDVSLVLHIPLPKKERKIIQTTIMDKKHSLKFDKIPHTLIYERPSDTHLYQSCNAYVCPSRGHGFDLFCAEAITSGLPVIATDHTDYLDHKNSTLVNSIKDEPSIPHLRECMRKTYVHYDDALAKTKNYNRVSDVNIGVQLLEVIDSFQ